MNTSDIIALWQAIIATFTLLLGIIAGIIAFQGYLKLIKSADENAKERQVAINDTADKTSRFISDAALKFKDTSHKQQYLLGGLCAIVLGMLIWSHYDVGKMREELRKLKR